MKISGCVAFYNNAETVQKAIDSLRNQMPELDEIVAIDDGSTDGGFSPVKQTDLRVVRLEKNQGRGAARARAMAETSGDFLLSVDGTKALAPGFLAAALSHMQDARVATVHGRNWQPKSQSAVERWRGRHLFKMKSRSGVRINAGLNTNGVLLRRDAIELVGGFDQARRHSEDADLGLRLTHAGFKVVYDPDLLVEECAPNNWRQIFERQWRYNVGLNDRFSFDSWFSFVRQAWAVMLPRDCKMRDWKCALASLLFPMALLVFWNSWATPRARNLENTNR